MKYTSPIFIPVLTTLALLLLPACDSKKEPPAQVVNETPIPSPAAEHDISLIAGCSGCHGADGVSSNPDTPFIAGQPAKYLASTMRAYLVTDRKHDVMRQAVFDLDVAQRMELANHFASLKTKWQGGNESLTPDTHQSKALKPGPENIRAGKVKSRPCAGCHGIDGNSIKTGVPSIAGLQPAYFVPAVKAYLSGKRRGAAIMKNFKLSLNNQDINNLAAYYSVQQRTRSPLSANLQKTVPSDALAPSCVGCHGENGNSTHPAMPSLAGQNATYLIKAMKTYREGTRGNQMMANIARDLGDEDIERNAVYFATRTPATIKMASPEKSTVEKFDPLGDGTRLAASCNGCHGNNGNHPHQGTPRLAGLHTTYLQDAITAYRDGNRKHPMMNMLTQYLSNTDIEKISLYYANQTAEKNKHGLKNADEKDGQGLASSCSGCHGEDGNSQDAKIPSLAGQDATYLITAINAYREKGSRTNKDMKGAVEEVNKKGVRNLAQYYSQLEPKAEKPRALESPEVLSEKCDRCHGDNGNNLDPEKPRIAGQRQSYLVNALNAYKKGDRIHTTMQAMSAELWTTEIEVIAAYYANK